MSVRGVGGAVLTWAAIIGFGYCLEQWPGRTMSVLVWAIISLAVFGALVGITVGAYHLTKS